MFFDYRRIVVVYKLLYIGTIHTSHTHTPTNTQFHIITYQHSHTQSHTLYMYVCVCIVYIGNILCVYFKTHLQQQQKQQIKFKVFFNKLWAKKKGKKDIFATSISVSLFRTATKVRKMCENCAKKNHKKYSVVCMHGHAWTCKVATAHTHGRFFPFTYIHINVMHVCVLVHTCTLAHSR